MIQHSPHTQGRNTINRRRMLTLITMAVAWLGIALVPSSAFELEAEMEEVRTASAAFYSALAVIDDGEAMAKVWAHTPYVTNVGPRAKSIMVGWKAQEKYWVEAAKRFSQINVTLSDQQIHVNGNLAWEMGQESGPINTTDGRVIEVDILVTNVYEKLDGRWLMVSHHVQPKPK